MKTEIAEKLLAKTVEDYSAIAEDWHQSRQYFWQDQMFLVDYIKDGDKVLDAGCGNGRFLSTLVNKKVEYIGLDNCLPLLAKAQASHPRSKFIEGDILDLPFENNKFDVVVCIAVLHHIPSKKLRQQAIAELKRVLKPDGLLIATVWDVYSDRYFKLILKYSFLKVFGLSQLDFKDVLMPFGKKVNRYLHAFTLREFKKLLESSRMKIEKSGQSKNKGKGISNFYIIARK